MTQRFADQHVLVTGAGSGIGKAMATRFGAEGARVTLVDIDEGAGRAAAEAIGGAFVACDVADEAGVSQMLAAAEAANGPLRVLCNNAGISPPEDASVLETSLEVWRRVQEVNLTSVFLGCKHGIPRILAAGGGAVVNTASFVATMGAATSQISYTASKGGVVALSRELGVEFAKRGVRVNALCPGPVRTALLEDLFAADPDQAARRLVHVPMGRFAEAEEVAAAAAFLASEDASYITAAAFLVDGGISGAYVTPE